MSQIEIDPVTRIEGHLTVKVQLDQKGKVTRTMADFAEFRGFEKFLEGRLVHRAPIIVTRICGVCPIPHHLASAKAIDNGLGLEIPERAEKLRELMLMGEILGDHTLHTFILAGPDFLLPELPYTQRDIIGVYRKFPEVAKQVVYTRAVGQKVIETIGVQAVHPMTAVPGGINRGFDEDMRKKLLGYVQEAKKNVIGWYDAAIAPIFNKFVDDNIELGKVESGYFGMSNGGNVNFYQGTINIVDKTGAKISEFNAPDYLNQIVEEPLSYSYGKSVTVKGQPKERAFIRTGPLARVNVNKGMGTEVADRLLKELRGKYGNPVHGTLQYDLARYVNLVFAAERLEQLLSDPTICQGELKTPFKMKAGEGAGSCEAARGTVIHNYKWDDQGFITKANIITPTVINANGFEASLWSAANRNVSPGKVNEDLLWHEVGLVIRAYDPCISCATHLERALKVELVNEDGSVRKVIGGN
ncbi:MAG TPA: Ni/Fe hydrogenase subunit alpha [Conexivisphaerales archaeon]|nr:Ni/Fe hydrogenase subunit alpha [Conexivisphaerales archaeon]